MLLNVQLKAKETLSEDGMAIGADTETTSEEESDDVTRLGMVI